MIARKRGMALVLVLAMLVLMLGVTLAYFSRASLQRRISASSASNMQVDILAQTGVETIISDFLQEIEAGSEPDDMTGTTVSIKMPIWITGTDNLRYAPSMAPQRVADNGIPNVVKVSRSGSAFFQNIPGYNPSNTSIPRASDIPTSSRSSNGREIPKQRWNDPALISTGTNGDFSRFQVPDWIYVDREGTNPDSFDASNLKALSSSDRNNSSYVIGRYAYVVYDVGGLLDINVLGNALDEETNARRGRLHQVSTGTTSIAIPKIADIVKWRWPNTQGNSSATNGGLFDPKRTFLDVTPGEQSFLNRQDLMLFAKKKANGSNDPMIPEDKLSFLTTFSRDVNAPLYGPDPTRPLLPISRPADQFNPTVPSVRFSGSTTLNRPEGVVKVASGTPVMPRKFPLEKLSLLEAEDPDEDAIFYYFGLRKILGNWKYAASSNDGRIKKLSEVATESREPNFFEILQAVIYTGSLGKGGQDPSIDSAQKFISTIRDEKANLQIMQIGANIIDQWDTNDFPTTIDFTPPSAPSTNPTLVYGVENLPYINQMTMIPYRPEYDRDKTQLWLVIDVWNPHQNATIPPQGIQSFRVVPTAGNAKLSTSYLVETSTTSVSDDKKLRNELSSAYQSIPELNSSLALTFSASSTYAEPTIIGVEQPTAVTSPTGILLGELSRGPAVPPRSDRSYDDEVKINSVVDKISPYTTSPANAAFTLNTSSGKREYPAGTTFIGSNPSAPFATFWQMESSPSKVVVSGNYAAKAHNRVELLSAEATDIELQMQIADGTWHTYQKIEGLFIKPSGNGGTDSVVSLTHQRDKPFDSTQGLTIIHKNSHHDSTTDLVYCFYQWRTLVTKHETGCLTYKLLDPRSQRFGLPNIENDLLATSTRSSAQPWTGSTNKKTLTWPYVRLNIPTHGFESWKGENFAPFGLIANNPDLPAGSLNGYFPTRYSDVDNVIRPADGYFGSTTTGALPSLLGNFADRPLILNRPFRSVGELGYAFRDLPWKTIDFSSRHSADAGLLDVFSLNEPPLGNKAVAGRVNLNTRQTSVLSAILKGTATRLGDTGGGLAFEIITPVEADAIATAITTESASRPFSTSGELLKRIFDRQGSPLSSSLTKVQREAAIRTLAELTTTRTWNFMIDIIAQSGRFPADSSTGADFVVKAECRRWVHVAIDRITGEVVEVKTEVVNE